MNKFKNNIYINFLAFKLGTYLNTYYVSNINYLSYSQFIMLAFLRKSFFLIIYSIFEGAKKLFWVLPVIVISSLKVMKCIHR